MSERCGAARAAALDGVDPVLLVKDSPTIATFNHPTTRHTDFPRAVCGALAGLIAIAALGSGAAAEDWPQWGGPQRDLAWRETGIVETLPEADGATGMLPRMWTAKIGAGYAGPAVADGRVFVSDRLADENVERVLCFDAQTGHPLWTHRYEARYTISYPLGPRATPTVDGQRVYVLGAVGHLFCFNAATGDVLWQKFLPADFGTEVPVWGMAGAPLVDGDQLIVLAGGKPGATVISLDKHTGEERWRALDAKEPGYCAPVIFEIGGRPQLIIWHPAAIASLDPSNGRLLWQEPFVVGAGTAIATPRLQNNRLLVTCFYGGPLMVDLGDDGLSPRVLWRTAASNNELKNDSLHAVMCTPILTPDHVFGVGGFGELRCLDASSGRMLWETHDATGPGRWWNAFLVPHGNRVVICNEQGEIIFARLRGQGYEELSRAKLIEPTQPVQRRMTVWSHPAFAERSVFARNDRELIRVNLAERAE
jgi:outer membrane protein assembly factor BamB